MSAKQSLFTSTEQMLVLGTEELSSQTIFIFLEKKKEGRMHMRLPRPSLRFQSHLMPLPPEA